MWARHQPKVVLIQLIREENNKLCLKAPGMQHLLIEPEDLAYDKSKEISSKFLDVNITTILCGEKYDKWISTYFMGKHYDTYIHIHT